MYRCSNPAYCPDENIDFDSLDDFQNYCIECFGEEADIHEVGLDYHDDETLVLEYVDA